MWKGAKNMNRRAICISLFAIILIGGFAMTADAKDEKATNPVVEMKTNMGVIKIELYPDKAPKSVENLLWYIEKRFYENLVFHRVIPNFMIQGGGFTKDMSKKEPNAPIINEATNGLGNDRGTLAMARTMEINSATCQFFINLKDNDFLNHKDKTSRGYGYAVFGKIIEGLEVMDKIAEVKTTTKGGYENVPSSPVIIEKAYVLDETEKDTKKKDKE